MHLFTRGDRRKKLKASIVGIDSAEELREELGEALYAKLVEDIDVLDSLVSPPDLERIQVGSMQCIYCIVLYCNVCIYMCMYV